MWFSDWNYYWYSDILSVGGCLIWMLPSRNGGFARRTDTFLHQPHLYATTNVLTDKACTTVPALPNQNALDTFLLLYNLKSKQFNIRTVYRFIFAILFVHTFLSWTNSTTVYRLIFAILFFHAFCSRTRMWIQHSSIFHIFKRVC